MNLDRTRLLASLCLLALAACKESGGLDEGKSIDPADSADAAAPTDSGGFQLPPFDLSDIADLFPRRDAGRPQEPARDAGNPAQPTILRVGPQGDTLFADGIALDVPRGAVTRSTEITFSALPSPPPGFVGRAWLISPPDTRFAVVAHVAIQLTPELLAIAPANELAVATLRNGMWVALPGQRNDPDGILVLGETQVLGAFALIKVPPRGQADASVPDAGSRDAGAGDASLDAGSVDASVEDAASDASSLDAEIVDAAPQPFCQPGACANGTCIEGASDFGCACNAGFTLAADLHSCADVDECTLGSLTCAGGKVCVNAPGSAACACPTGTELTPSDTCAAPGTYCLPTSCAPGSCVQGASDFSCTCPTGYAGAKECADVDECASGTACLAGNTCTNSVGSYTCACIDTYVAVGDGTCVPPTPPPPPPPTCTPPLVLVGGVNCGCAPPTMLQMDGTCL